MRQFTGLTLAVLLRGQIIYIVSALSGTAEPLLSQMVQQYHLHLQPALHMGYQDQKLDHGSRLPS